MTRVKINLLNGGILNINETSDIVEINIEPQDKHIVVNVIGLGSDGSKIISIPLDPIIYGRLKQLNEFDNNNPTPVEG